MRVRSPRSPGGLQTPGHRTMERSAKKTDPYGIKICEDLIPTIPIELDRLVPWSGPLVIPEDFSRKEPKDDTP